MDVLCSGEKAKESVRLFLAKAPRCSVFHNLKGISNPRLVPARYCGPQFVCKRSKVFDYPLDFKEGR